MKLLNTTNAYGILTKWTHWILASLILLQYAYIWIREGLLDEQSKASLNLLIHFHKPFGLLILILVTFFILWKAFNKHPHYPKTMALWERFSAHMTHWLLLLLTLIMALSGLMMSIAAGYPPSFFNLFTIPSFISKNPALAKQLAEMHELCSYLLLALILVHVLAALKHHFIDKDNILKRMKL